MFTKLRRPALWLALLSATLIVTIGIAACARLGLAGPDVTPFPTSAATVQPGQPTAAATAQPGQPTATVAATVQPAQPTTAATVQPGQPSPTSVANDAFVGAVRQVSAMLDTHVAGGDLRPFLTGAASDLITNGKSVEYVLGLKPQPAQSYTLGPARLVQGADGVEVPAAVNYGGIVSEFLFTVVWDGAQRVGGGLLTRDGQADAYPQTQEALVTKALDEAFRGGEVRPYLSQELVDAIHAGKSTYDVLGLRLADASGYSFGEAYSYPAADLSFLPVTINYYEGAEQRIFTVAMNHSETPARLKIYGSQLARESRPVATSPEDAANHLLLEIWAERSGVRAMPYLFGELRERVARGEPVDLLEDGGVGPLRPLYSFDIGGVVAEDDTYKWVEVSLNLDGQAGITRFVKVQQVDGFWRVVAVISSLANEPPPTSFPGDGWTAWKRGDFNGDGIEETVFLKETGAVNYDRLEDPLLNSNSLNATAVLVVQSSAEGPWTLLEIDSQSARTSDGYSAPFVSEAAPEGPAFFQVSVSYAYEGRFLHVLPLKADGYAYTQALAFKWDPAASGYRLIGGPHGEW